MFLTIYEWFNRKIEEKRVAGAHKKFELRQHTEMYLPNLESTRY